MSTETHIASATEIIKKEYKLRNTWRLYFHSVTEDSWDDSTYKKLVDINTINRFNQVINNIKNVTAGMFFLMKEDIFPTYEDPNNTDGGYWTFRVSKKYANDVWEELTARLIGNTLTKDPKNMSQINGVTMSPKISNCIFKIWNVNAEVKDPYILMDDIAHINLSEAKYQTHKANIERSKMYRSEK